jgi:hypothetical protein
MTTKIDGQRPSRYVSLMQYYAAIIQTQFTQSFILAYGVQHSHRVADAVLASKTEIHSD